VCSDRDTFPLRWGKLCAFSLVEVALALGLAAFATLAIFGLLSAGIDGSRAASNDAAIARTASSVVSQLRQKPFNNLRGLNEDFFFSDSGIAVSNATDAAYRCRVETSAFTLPELLPEAAAAASPLRIRMSFYIPPENPQPIEIIETILSKY
jgi:uncharacterized protein (TIGR02598 family)